MLSRFIFIFLVLYGSVSVAAPPTDEDFDRWVANWKSLVKPGAYDFVPKDVSFDLMFSKDFQEKVHNHIAKYEIDKLKERIEVLENSMIKKNKK